MLAPSPDCVYECEPWNVCDGLGRLTARTHPSGRMGGEISEEREGPEPGWILRLVYLSLLPLESSGKIFHLGTLAGQNLPVAWKHFLMVSTADSQRRP